MLQEPLLHDAPSLFFTGDSVEDAKVRPFLRWVGGKSQLITDISMCIEGLTFNRYFEPFLGGGAVFFKLVPSQKTSYLSDINDNLINAYIKIRDNVDSVLNEYAALVQSFSEIPIGSRKDFFNKVRSDYNHKKGTYTSKKAAQLIFLNKTCFNGVYRENSSGDFNVPYGDPNVQSISNVDHIRKVARKLQGQEISVKHASDIISQVSEGDLVYLDPPYVPTSKTAAFTKYHATGFTTFDHEEVYRLFDALDKKGCFVLMSNSLTPKVRDLYKDYWKYTVEVDANRNINCKGELRKPVKEVLIKNY